MIPCSLASPIAILIFADSPEMTIWPGQFRLATSTSVSAAKARAAASSHPIKAAMEPLAVITYHQPVTRAAIEEIRGVSLSRGSMELLLEIMDYPLPVRKPGS